MKIWIEFSEATRFAKKRGDILYTPIFFANEGVSANFCLDDEWRRDSSLSHLDVKITLVGHASLGFLSIGGRPANGLDTRYALPDVGFRSIYTLSILEMSQELQLQEENKVPFSFTLPTATLADLQQLASSMKVISADSSTTMNILKDTSPALIVSVTYNLKAEISHAGEVKSTSKQEIRIFVGLTGDQVPSITPEIVARNPLAETIMTQIVPLGRSRRRSSIPLLRRRSSARATSISSSLSDQAGSHLTVEAHVSKPFTFRAHDDAAPAKVDITLRYIGDNSTNPSSTPPTISASITWLMKSHTSLTLEPAERPGGDTTTLPDDYFHLRFKIFPLRKAKMKWSEWKQSNTATPGSQENVYASTQSLWLTQPVTSALTPSFTTSYLTHLYTLNLSMSLNLDTSKAPFGLGKKDVELIVPVQVRYDLGLAPSYEVDGTLPEYDHTLPRYSDDIVAEEGEGDDQDEDEVMAALMRREMNLEDRERNGGRNRFGQGGTNDVVGMLQRYSTA